jgi:hypothetical protein
MPVRSEKFMALAAPGHRFAYTIARCGLHAFTSFAMFGQLRVSSEALEFFGLRSDSIAY